MIFCETQFMQLMLILCLVFSLLDRKLQTVAYLQSLLIFMVRYVFNPSLYSNTNSKRLEQKFGQTI